MDFVQVKAKFPAYVSFFTARILIDEFVTDSLNEFKVVPTNEQLQTFISKRYKNDTCDKYYCLMVELTAEEVINTASSRSMSTYEAPVHKRKLQKKERTLLKSFRKKIKSSKKKTICEICQENLSNHVYIVPCCKSMFHGSCLRKAFEWRETCPMCYVNLKDLLDKTTNQT